MNPVRVKTKCCVLGHDFILLYVLCPDVGSFCKVNFSNNTYLSLIKYQYF